MRNLQKKKLNDLQKYLKQQRLVSRGLLNNEKHKSGKLNYLKKNNNKTN